jgi:hypothetical protein
MLHIALCSVRYDNNESTTARRIERRAKWTPPAGLNIKAEYWLDTPNPQVIIVAEADQPAAFLAAVAAWDDLFNITIVPAVTAEEGLQLASALAGGAG